MNSYLAREKNRLSESNDFLYGIESIMAGGHVRQATARIAESFIRDRQWARYSQIPYTMTIHAIY